MRDQVQLQPYRLVMYASRLYLCNNTTPSAGTFNGGTGAWTIGTLTNGSSATLYHRNRKRFG
jgi:hypothetical protein